MLRMFSLVVLVAGLFAISLSSGYAHSGGTDRYGCHIDHKTGLRHCH